MPASQRFAAGTRTTDNPAGPLCADSPRRVSDSQRTGASLATGPLLDFQLAHARARDAVHEPLDAVAACRRLRALDMPVLALPVLAVASAATDRQRYLMRPDLGRRLAPGAEAVLAPHAATTTSCSSSPTAFRRAPCRRMRAPVLGPRACRRCAPRRLADRAARHRPPRPRRDRRRGRGRARRRLRRRPDRRASGPHRRPTAWAPI